MAVQRAVLPGSALTPRARIALALGLGAGVLERGIPERAPVRRRPAARPAARERGRTVSRSTTVARRPVAIGPARRSTARPAGIVAAVPRPRRSLSIIAAIVAATLIGLVYLTQQLATAGVRYEIDTLLMERQTLERTLRSQAGLVAQRASEAVVVGRALDGGLGRVPQGVRVRVP